MVFVHQHRAHVRILYDRYLKQLELRKAFSQTMLFPVELHLDAGQQMDLQVMAEDLQALGFQFDYSGPVVNITAIPVDSKGKNPDELVIELLGSVNESVSDSKSIAIEKLALNMANAVAIPEGQTLNPEEMDTIISGLLESSEQKYTPDGKIICCLISPDELSKRFYS
jgi:DNA mismatch repair protein MutL